MTDALDMVFRQLRSSACSCNFENDHFWVDELAHEISILNEPNLDAKIRTPKFRDFEGLTIEGLTSLTAEGCKSRSVCMQCGNTELFVSRSFFIGKFSLCHSPW
jgi:hypothetical protein